MGEISLTCLKLSWCWSLVSGDLGRHRSTLLRWCESLLVRRSPTAPGGCCPVCRFSSVGWKGSKWLHADVLPQVLIFLTVCTPGLLKICAGRLELLGAERPWPCPSSACLSFLVALISWRGIKVVSWSFSGCKMGWWLSFLSSQLWWELVYCPWLVCQPHPETLN